MKHPSFITLLLLSYFTSIEARTLCVADPTIFVEDNKYYLYGTAANSDTGFEVYVSDNLKDWEGPVGINNGLALTPGDAFGSRWFWAPQVIKVDSTYYMIYTAEEQIAVAHAESPLGPFINAGNPLPYETRRIDPFLFCDRDGNNYLYHVKLDGENKICCSDGKGAMKECIKASPDTWEDVANAYWRVAEGPTVIRTGDKYHLFYSANDFRNRGYAVGHATADNPLGPWHKDSTPIISMDNTGYAGTGHGDIFTDNEGNLRYVFHAHASQDNVAPRQTLIISLNQNPEGSFSADPASIIIPNLSEQ